MDQKHKTQIESIRLADFPDLPAISDAWRVAYAELYPYKYPHRWRWMFEENPFSQRDGGKKLPMIIATTKNRVAAWACAMETPVFFDNDIIPAAFSCNTFTLPEFRQRGLGGAHPEENYSGLPGSLEYQHVLGKPPEQDP